MEVSKKTVSGGRVGFFFVTHKEPRAMEHEALSARNGGRCFREWAPRGKRFAYLLTKLPPEMDQNRQKSDLAV